MTNVTDDITSAVPCGFNDFLRAFIYNCLFDTSEIDAIENGIAKLNLTDEQELEAKILRGRRDDILNSHLQDCLEGVLDISNDDHIRALLAKYLESLSSGDESEKYGSYAELCNASFDSLRKLELRALRSAVGSSNYLCCRRIDPLDFPTFSNGIVQNPDVGYTSAATVLALGESLSAQPKLAEHGGSFSDFHCLVVFESNSEAAPVRDLPAKFTLSKRECDAGINGSNLVMEAVARSTAQAGINLGKATMLESQHSSGSPALGKRKCTSESDDHRETRATKRHKSRLETRYSLASESPTQDSKSLSPTHGQIRSGVYASEMLIQNVGRHHVVNLLHIGDTVFIWYYDRQGILRSEGINIILEFPRFLVLLLVFQRFTPANWGLVEELDAPDSSFKLGGNAEKESLLLELQLDSKTTFDRKWKNPDLQNVVAIRYDDMGYLSSKPCNLSSRATRVLKATGGYKNSNEVIDLAVKISYPELRRCHEGEVLAGICKVADEFDAESSEEDKIKNHLPDILFYGDVMQTGTRLIRSLVGVPTTGHRVMRVLVMNRLEPLHELDGLAFLEAWLDALTCHAFLWKHGIKHGDPSLHNIMYNPTTKRGVLTDFDLSVIQWEERNRSIDHAGTVPFMALDLLCKDYWSGNMAREYYHELEAFFWILLYAALDNAEGADAKALMDKWKTRDWEKCLPVKEGLLKGTGHLSNYRTFVPASFQLCFFIASRIFAKVNRDHHARQDEQYEDENWMEDDDAGELASDYLKKQRRHAKGTRTTADEWSKSLFDKLLENLGDLASSTKDGGRFKSLVERLKKHQPYFQTMTDERKAQIKDIYYGSPTSPQTQAGVQPSTLTSGDSGSSGRTGLGAKRSKDAASG